MDVMDIKGMKFRKVIFGETRVVLTSDHYGAELAEPVYGSEYECVGTIVGESDELDTPVAVNWDNGEGNLYKLEDLRAVAKTDTSNPNSSFRKKKADDIKKKRQEHQQKSKQKLMKAVEGFKPSELSTLNAGVKKGTEVHKAYSEHIKKSKYLIDPSEFDKLNQHSEDEYDR